jgi:WD40 repeat protein
MVLGHGDFGKVEPSNVNLVNGHKSPAIALEFSPFSLPDGGSMLATGSDDQRVKLWSIPKGGLTASLGAEDAMDLSGMSAYHTHTYHHIV